MKKLMLVIAMVSMAVFGETAQTKYFNKKCTDQLVVRQQQIISETQKLEILTNDYQLFKTTINSIVVPKVHTIKITNYISRSTKYVIDKVISNDVQTVRLKRLQLAMNNPTLNKLYEKYCGSDSTIMLREFKEEMELANASYKKTLRQLRENDSQYRSSISTINKDRENEFKQNAQSIQNEINRAKHRMFNCARRNGRMSCNCSQCNDDKVYIKACESQLKSLNTAYRQNRFTDAREEALSKKTDKSDRQLAEADYRDQKQNIFNDFKERFVSKFVNVIKTKMEITQDNIKQYCDECKRLQFIIDHPDLIKQEHINAIVQNDVIKVLNDQFNIGVEKIDAAIENKRVDKERAERLSIDQQQERLYQEKLAEIEARKSLTEQVQRNRHEKEMLKLRIELQKEQNKNNGGFILFGGSN